MRARCMDAMRWSTAIVVALTVWWNCQLHRERAAYETLARHDQALRQRLAQAGSELAEVQQTTRGTLDSLSESTHTVERIVAQLQRQGVAVTMTCQEPTALTLATLSLVATPCRIVVPPLSVVSLIEVLTVIEQTQSLLQWMRIHVTEGTTIDLQLYGYAQPTAIEIGERTTR